LQQIHKNTTNRSKWSLGLTLYPKVAMGSDRGLRDGSPPPGGVQGQCLPDRFQFVFNLICAHIQQQSFSFWRTLSKYRRKFYPTKAIRWTLVSGKKSGDLDSDRPELNFFK